MDKLAGAIAQIPSASGNRSESEPPQTHDARLDEDIREHIAMETQENIERGMSAEDARYAAMRKFGNVTLVKENTRAVWSICVDQAVAAGSIRTCLCCIYCAVTGTLSIAGP